MLRSILLSAAAALLPVSIAPAAEPGATGAAGVPRPVALDDINRIESPDGPYLSRDGRQVAYVVDKQIYVVPTNGGPSRAVTAAGSTASTPYWSKDGRALYFLSDRSGSSQLWKLPVAAFGEASQVTRFEQGIEALNFSADESHLLLGFTESKLAESADKDAAKEKKPEPWVITRLEFKEDAGDGYLTGDRAEHLYAYDLASGKLSQLTSGRFGESEAAWSPDGGSVVLSSNREDEPDASYKTDLWLVAADNTDRGQSLVRLTNDDRVKSAPAWSPDGRFIAFLTAEDGVYGSPQLAVMPTAGGEPRILTAGLDRWINSFKYSPDGEWLYFLFENDGGSHLARVRPRDGRLERLLEGELHVSAFDVAPSGVVAARIENANDAPELYVLNKSRPRRLTDVNDAYLRSVTLGDKRRVEFRSPDGTLVEAFVTTPPGFDPKRRYPTILHIHGGPVSRFAYGYGFQPQYLAANGYVVVEPNPRGSTGRDQAFVRAIYQTWGITDYDDLIAAIDHVIGLGYADPERLGVFGYSYGGYMTNTVITRTQRFKAAASGAGHSMIVANYGHDIYQKWYNWELGVPWENREKYERLSPLTQAGRVTTPTLFLGGRDDWNVPVLNAELFYQSLRARGVDTQLVVYPDTHHSGWSEEFEKDYLHRVQAWFDKYLK
jgi:dipeptidyl aminopeptidase/acylaminoacyl peptidase